MNATESDARRLVFKPSVRAIEYGDRRTFMEYKILMFHGSRLVGIEEGPRRATPERSAALAAARARIRALLSHRLYVIRVTRKCISDGDARSCQTCAVAQALWRNQDRMGFPKWSYRFDVSPYGSFAAHGIVIWSCYGREEMRIPVEGMPLIAIGVFGGRPRSETMQEWAMRWDDWAESRSMSRAEWREEHPYENDERPGRPGPCSFVLDLDAMRPAAEARS